MAQTLETLARRTTSMRGIRSVVHTMKTLSVINAAPYAQAAKAVGAYHAAVLDGLHAYLIAVGPLPPPRTDAGAQTLIVFGTDHGLCGNYNARLAAHVAEQPAHRVLCVGAQMADALADCHIAAARVFLPAASLDGIGRLATLLTQALDDPGKGGAAVSLAYIAPQEAGGQGPVILPLLPIDEALLGGLSAKPWASRSRPMFTMPQGALFAALIRSHLFATLFQAIAQALMSENAARLALMQQAERSIDDRLEALAAQTRAMRQDEITTELLDVIIGFEALKPKRADVRQAPAPDAP